MPIVSSSPAVPPIPPQAIHRQFEFDALVRIDTPQEAQYYANGGILQYVLRQLLTSKPQAVHA
jgi:hypothetical protein